MAGDWIPWVKGLPRRREVLAIAGATGRSPYEVAALLCEFWSWVDDETEDGIIRHVSVTLLSRCVRDTDETFWRAVISVGWLVEHTEHIEIPNFSRWLSYPAKGRMLASRRKQKERNNPNKKAAKDESCHANVTLMSRSERDKIATREEKRRDINTESFVFTKDSCSEPLSAISEPHIMSFPTNGKTESWGLTQSKLDEWKQTYPGVDAEAECRKAWQWCQDNPTRRKTARGMTRFLSSWLERAQNRAGASGDPQGLFEKRTPGRGNSASGKPSPTDGIMDWMNRQSEGKE